MKLKKIIFAGLAFYGAKKLVEKMVNKYSDQIEAFARKKGAEIGEKIASEIFSKKSEKKEAKCETYDMYLLASVLKDISNESDVFIEKAFPKASKYRYSYEGEGRFNEVFERDGMLGRILDAYSPQEIISIWRVAKWQK